MFYNQYVIIRGDEESKSFFISDRKSLQLIKITIRNVDSGRNSGAAKCKDIEWSEVRAKEDILFKASRPWKTLEKVLRIFDENLELLRLVKCEINQIKYLLNHILSV